MGRILAQPTLTVEDAPMRIDHQIDICLAAKQLRGDLNSPNSLRLYRSVLNAHAEDVGYRDAATTTREHVLITLSRWENPNTSRKRLSVLRSFYKWLVQEGYRKDNPADQVPAIKARPTAVYRMTVQEIERLLNAAVTTRERRIVTLGVCAGLRNSELRGMQGRHFARPGFVWVSPDIGKGGRERWVPIIGQLTDVAEDIIATTKTDEYVIPARRWAYVVGPKRRQIDHPHLPSSPQSLKTAMENLKTRAGIAAHITPHTMRHAFGDHIAKHLGLKAAQELLGHMDVSTTQRAYTGKYTPDELAHVVSGFRFEQMFPGAENHPHIAREAPTGIEPVLSSSGLILPNAVYRKAGRDDA